MAIKKKPAPARRLHPATIYARTGKGVLSFKDGTAKASHEIKSLFGVIDGKASVTELGSKTGLDVAELEEALEALEEAGYVRIFKEGTASSTREAKDVPPDADSPDLDFTSAAAAPSLLEVAVRQATEAKQKREAEQQASASAAPVASEPPAAAKAAVDTEPLQARIREIEAALTQAQQATAAERAAREEALRARDAAMKALASAKAAAGEKVHAAPQGDEKALHEELTQAQERVAHIEAQLETERETREKTVQALRESQSQAELGRNAAEMRVKEMQISLEAAEKLDRQNRDRLKQLEGQVESGRKARAEAEAKLAAEADQTRKTLETELAAAKQERDAERGARAEADQARKTLETGLAAAKQERDAERGARAEAEAKAKAERESREKVIQALAEVKRAIGAIEP